MTKVQKMIGSQLRVKCPSNKLKRLSDRVENDERLFNGVLPFGISSVIRGNGQAAPKIAVLNSRNFYHKELSSVVIRIFILNASLLLLLPHLLEKFIGNGLSS